MVSHGIQKSINNGLQGDHFIPIHSIFKLFSYSLERQRYDKWFKCRVVGWAAWEILAQGVEATYQMFSMPIKFISSKICRDTYKSPRQTRFEEPPKAPKRNWMHPNDKCIDNSYAKLCPYVSTKHKNTNGRKPHILSFFITSKGNLYTLTSCSGKL